MKEKYMNNERESRGLRREAEIIEEAAAEPVEVETAEEPVVEEAPKKESKVGVVENCTKLNLRKEPVKDTDGKNIITELIAGTAVVIDDEKSTDEFFNVTTEDGTEGYCMKQFIRLA